MTEFEQTGMAPGGRRSWHSLTDAQRGIAAAITARADVLHAAADGELSRRDAVELAAYQLGYQNSATIGDPQ